ncbi:hypothetical protein, partial [Sansalvadorimonas verongulae]|uniref:hypothetical protein n=1 Tax=Sansalvadorimonas verongulae TaxID=2172824 RepID=UPI0012BD815C
MTVYLYPAVPSKVDGRPQTTIGSFKTATMDAKYFSASDLEGDIDVTLRIWRDSVPHYDRYQEMQMLQHIHQISLESAPPVFVPISRGTLQNVHSPYTVPNRKNGVYLSSFKGSLLNAVVLNSDSSVSQEIDILMEVIEGIKWLHQKGITLSKVVGTSVLSGLRPDEIFLDERMKPVATSWLYALDGHLTSPVSVIMHDRSMQSLTLQQLDLLEYARLVVEVIHHGVSNSYEQAWKWASSMVRGDEEMEGYGQKTQAKKQLYALSKRLLQEPWHMDAEIIA